MGHGTGQRELSWVKYSRILCRNMTINAAVNANATTMLADASLAQAQKTESIKKNRVIPVYKVGR